MKSFVFNKYIFNLITLRKGFISDFASSMIRGSLFNSLRAIVCLTKNEICKDCIVWQQCAYSYFFENPPEKQEAILKLGEGVPHPYIIEMPFPFTNFLEEGNAFAFKIILIGKSISFLPHLICAAIRMCEKGIGKDKIKFILDSVEVEKKDSSKLIIFDKKILKEHPIFFRAESFFIEDKEKISANRISLHFTTPVRIKHEGKLCSELSFGLFIKNVLRRITILSMLYSDEAIEEESIDINAADLLEKSKLIRTISSSMSWVDLTRYSSKQKMEMQLGGLMGKITFEGQINQFMPYIKLCEQLHIGKNTSFGLGKYQISE